MEPAEWAAQFKGKSVFDRFVVGSDIDAISRASISIKSGTRCGARQRAGRGPRVLEPRTGQAARELSALPSPVEEHRDHHWRRDVTRVVQTVIEAERFIEQVGFAASMTDSRRPGPSLYIAVCGRRDAVMPRNVQTDPEASLTWTLKDQVLRRGKVYYAKFARGKTLFVAPRMVPSLPRDLGDATGRGDGPAERRGPSHHARAAT